MGRPCRWSLGFLALALVTACGGPDAAPAAGDPADPAPLVRGDTVDPQVAERLLADFERLESVERERRVAALDARVERATWTLSGLEEAVGGPDAADGTFAALYERVRADLPALSRQVQQPAAFGRSAPPGATVTEAAGAALFGGLVITAASARGAASLADGENTGSTTADGITRSATRDTGSITASRTAVVDGVEVTIDTSTTVRACPGPDGVAVAEGSIGTTVRKGGTGLRSTYSAKVRVQVGDDAEVVSETHDLRSERSDFAGGKGTYADVSLTQGQWVVNRTAGRLPENYVQESVNATLFMGSILVQFLVDAAQERWQSGACVRLAPRPSKGPTGLDPGDRVTVLAEPRAKLDGRPTGGTVTAVLTAGEASVSPSGSKVPADATFTYTAPARTARTGDVELESRSRRGVGKASVHFDTFESSFAAEGGGGDYRGTGVICSLSRPFTVSGSGLQQRFTPRGETSGTYVLSGRAGGVSWSGDGTYRVDLNSARTAGTLTTTGTNTIRTPRGTFSDTARATFTLRAIANCD